MSALHWLLPVIGIGFVIFVHELGHFMAARAVGVRVEAFSIGFGPRLFGFRRGDTDWKVCLIPLGGFVKMAGETPGSEKTGAPDEFASKSVWQRSLVISAGVIMNVIFALVALPVAFMMGVPFESPVIGHVVPDGPAWKAGLRAHDRLVSIDGRRVLGFEDALTGIAIGSDVVTIDAERGGEPFTAHVAAEVDPDRGLPIVGIRPAYAPILVRDEDVEVARAPSDLAAAAAARRDAGLRAGDVIETIDGSPMSEAAGWIADLPARRSVTLGVRRNGALVTVVVPPVLKPVEDGPRLFGLVPHGETGRFVAPVEGTPAAAAGVLPGDEVVSANGTPVSTFEEVRKLSQDSNVNHLTLGIRRGAETLEVTIERGPAVANVAFDGLTLDFERETVKTGFAGSFRAGFDYTVMMTARVFMTLKSLFTRRVAARHLGGIITIFRQSAESSRIAPSRGLLFMAVISINLAVLNILPIPVLDGGWLLLLLIERFRGRPVSERTLGIVSWIGFALVLGLMVFVTWNDIVRLMGGG